MNCKLCASSSTKMMAHAVLAPWITAIISSTPQPKFSRLYLCSECGFQFFDYRYSDFEMNALYSNYRGEEYFTSRHSWEPWFTRKTMNSWHPSKNPFGVESRKAYMAALFSKNEIDLGSITGVLDFGGDLGQFFPQESRGAKYLVDPANSDNNDDGIIRVASLESINDSCELVMNCHTLEHIPDLSTTVTSLLPVLKKKVTSTSRFQLTCFLLINYIIPEFIFGF